MEPLRSGYALPAILQTCVLILIDAGLSPCLSRRIRRLLRTPEIIARTARALKRERPDLDESTVTAALTQFDDLWKALIPAEQARVVQLLVARVTVGEDGLDIDLRHDGLGVLASLMAPAREDAA